MRVDVVDGLTGQPRLVEGDPDGLGHLRAVRAESGHVVGVGAGRVPGDLGVDVRAAPAGAVQLLQDEDGGALAQYESVARRVEGAGGVGRVVVARRGGLDGVEAGQGDRGDRRVRRTGDHDVGRALADQFGGVADRVDSGGAPGGDHGAGAFRTDRPGHLRGEGARHEVVVEVRCRVRVVDQVEPAAVADDAVLLVEAHRGAHGAAHGDAGPVRVELAELDTAVGDRAARRDHGELRGTVHPADLLRGQTVFVGVEVDFGGDA